MLLKTVNSEIIRKQSGSALVIAVFVIVVMSLIGAALVRMLASSSEAVAYEVIGTRTFAAAQSGAQWQLALVFPLGSTTNVAACDTVAAEPDISTVSGIKNCSFTVTCSANEFNNEHYFVIKSTGSCSVGGIITSRTIEVEAQSL